MLLEFGAKNFFSFKEGFDVSMRSPKAHSKTQSYINVLAVKGANASGKTNVLKVLSFIGEFTINSFNEKPTNKIKFLSYFFNKEPTDIYIVFSINSIEYRYELSLTQDYIISETMYRKDKRGIKVFQREMNKLTSCIEEFKGLEAVKLRDNASIISTANQYEIDAMGQVYIAFNHILTNVNFLGMRDGPINYEWMTEVYLKHDEIFKFVQQTLKNIDTGINEIKIHSNEDKETGKTEYYPAFYFDTSSGKEALIFEHQSSGTKALYTQLGLYKFVLDSGGVLVMDEFDVNLHTDILPILIDFFENEEKNPNGAQLIFTSHHTEIMDILGKYRVVLVNKEDNESFLYRLDEIPGDMLRNDRSIVQKYKENKIGGKPKIKIL